MAQKTREQISHNMSRVRSTDSKIEQLLCSALDARGLVGYTRNDKFIFGKPDVVYRARKVVVFCDSEFFHGYDWENARHAIKSSQDFWIPKIERNIRRDAEVTERLRAEGWTVLRFWGKQVKQDALGCATVVERILRTPHQGTYRTIDLCAGIGGIRRGFELAGNFENVMSSEIDKYACQTYQHLYGDDPANDLTCDEFKATVCKTPYEILLAGFPCQTFSRVGLKEGFENEEKGKIFFHIAEIIKRTRPRAFFLENVDHLVTRDKGHTIQTILERLASLGFQVIGVEISEDGTLRYKPKSFVRNSKNFGVPQNRPRTYIIGFDRQRYSPEALARLPLELPQGRDEVLYQSLNDLLEPYVDERFYMAGGYLETLVRHRERQKAKGYNFGYRILNEEGVEAPIANTLLATGGSGRERNLIWQPRDGIAGRMVQGKKTPLNDQGIRVMTPTEWGKLQGFINYAFLDDEGRDGFSFPEGMPNVQKYKQFGNSVTIPAVEEMARFMLRCFELMEEPA